MDKHLKSTYGFNNFRECQKDIITDLINKENVFVILPTGGGKSLLYQFPATYTNKITIVVSPLISLMNDQCLYLNSINIRSVCLNSESNFNIGNLNEYKLIYTTPEYITSRIEMLKDLKDHIGLFAIDEAHCVSQWSHDFRESYQQLSIIKKTFPDIPLLAVTATATPRVLNEIYDILEVYEASEYSLGTRRTNLSISILPKSEFKKCTFNENTIIYVQTRKICEKLCEELLGKGIKCAHYHAGMSVKDKTKSHELFMKGDITVIVATISFGMGIDKSDIRHVINYGVPSDIESYYQEIGRAGRDGLSSRATLYYQEQDFSTAMFLISKSTEKKQIEIKINSLNIFRKYLSEHNLCRQQMIDYYFESGEFSTEKDISHIPKCNKCDNCLGCKEQITKDITNEAIIIVDIIDNHYKLKGFNIGVEKILVLIKKNTLFYDKSKKYCKDIIEILITKNILIRVPLKISGFTIATSNININTIIPITARINDNFTNNFTNIINDKLDKLYDIRKYFADKYSILPQSFINDRVLSNIYNISPKNLSELWSVDGISDEFIFIYGKEFIEKLNSNYFTNKVSDIKKYTNNIKKIDTKDITLELYNQGRSIEEISIIRGYTNQTIIDHILYLYKENKIPIDKNYFGLNEEYYQEIIRAFKVVGKEKLRNIKDIVDKKITYGQIKLSLFIYNKV